VRRTSALVTGALVALALAACSRDGRALRPPTPGQNQSIVTTSTSTTGAPSVGAPTSVALGDEVARFVVGLPWPNSGTIDAVYTCRGSGAMPRITWAETPAAAKEIAVTVVDDTAAGYVHWVIAGLDPASGVLEPGTLPPGATQALNGAGTRGWTPPCPPAGTTHRYRFTVYALSAPSGLADGADASSALGIVGRNVLALDVAFGLVVG
jgi:hypothetical protein